MAQVPNALSAPTHCDSCASPNVVYSTNDIVYGRIYGEWPYVYFCHDCRSAVGCHPNTKIPLGRMADADTRMLRSKCHDVFDRLWKTGVMSRSYAYLWLSRELGIAFDDCHISWLSKSQLQTAIEKVGEYNGSIEQLADRRKLRRGKRESKRIERDRKRGRVTDW